MPLPCFAAEFPGPSDPAAVLAWMRAPRPAVEVDLGELEEAVRGYRGVYETSWPTISAELALRQGPSSTRWLDREPDFRRSARPGRQTIRLYEVTPVPHPEGGYIIVHWTLRVLGEAERRWLWLLELAQEQSGSAAARRLEAAG